MSQQTYTHFNRVVNRNGDILPGQRKARIGSMTDLASSGDGDNLRPSTSQGLTEHQKPRYTSAGSEDLFLNLANDPLANTRSNRTEESQVSEAYKTLCDLADWSRSLQIATAQPDRFQPQAVIPCSHAEISPASRGPYLPHRMTGIGHVAPCTRLKNRLTALVTSTPPEFLAPITRPRH